jgi:hypothetical protein
MPQGKGTYGTKRGRPKKKNPPEPKSKPPKKKMASVELDGKKVKFKAGALRAMFKMKDNQKFSVSRINKMLKAEDGSTVEAFGTSRKMTKLLRKRLNFAKTLMKM